jgi:histidyl-tRNA synthetase
VKAQMRRAEKLGAKFAIVLGDNELNTGRGKLKEMAARTETEVDLAEIRARLAERL